MPVTQACSALNKVGTTITMACTLPNLRVPRRISQCHFLSISDEFLLFWKASMGLHTFIENIHNLSIQKASTHS
ncbi:hypothetical protein E6O75_ATG01636 [Venturia nashicola]|uniref:Uncharacterized protein n=1 Tax=Venturia nashicola TaxID=86259 RepID=A0A4Z1P1T0_9PEZI|nr:hypothetical protein E6O75_ATG01636 [Venturia nashicola]